MSNGKTGTTAQGSNKGTSTAAAAAKAAPTVKSINFKDVSLSYLMDKMAGIAKLEEAFGAPIPEAVLWKALESMEGQNTSALRDHAVKLYGEPKDGGVRGRSSPKVGEERVYKVQKLDKGEEFLRLPIGALAVAKGTNVSVKYEADRIVITKAPAGKSPTA